MNARLEWPLSTTLAVAIASAATIAALVVSVGRRGHDAQARCGPGFVGRLARCVPGRTETCPAPLTRTVDGCDAPDVRVSVPETTFVLGPSDWEAEGRVAPRTVRAGPFRMDAFEVTRRRWLLGAGIGAAASAEDAARAASGMTRSEAGAFCAHQTPSGRLPTEDEWIVAAIAGASPATRYPWGDTGAVCRRAAWGLSVGPCAADADGPDTVGAHPDGDSPLGLHDLAGNVAEWVAPAGGPPLPTAPSMFATAKGGSWKTALASELRVWARLEIAPDARDARVGFRCVYPN